MRAPRRHRPHNRTIAEPPAGVDLHAIARRARYVGSPEHKDYPSFAGEPRPRADASLCDRALRDQTQMTEWLQLAIERGAVGTPWEDDFPRYVWYRDGETLYEGRLVNRTRGEYKGYPLTPDEWPEGIERLYE